MKKRKLAIVSRHSYSVDIYYKELEPLFGEFIDLVKYSLDSHDSYDLIEADLVLISSFTIFQEVKKLVGNSTEIIVAEYTLAKKGLDMLRELPEGTEALLVNINYKVCIETILLLNQLGYSEYKLIPYYPEAGTVNERSLAITPGEKRLVPDFVEKTIDIGHRVLDISTITDIAAKLEIDTVIESEAFKRYYDEIVHFSYGIENIIGRNRMLNRQLDIILGSIDKGIIMIGSDGIVRSYNAAAEKIIGYRKGRIIGERADEVLSDIPCDAVSESGKGRVQKLISINSKNVVLTLSPIVNAGKFHGIVTVIEEFTEIEKKQHEIRVQLRGKGHVAKYNFNDILGDSTAINDCKSIAKRMAKSDSSVLITGESGTGKELFAQAIHNESYRKDYQFVAVNCAALPENLLESELFGYEKGAFTGARKEGRIGLFELAHKGTLFLDEIGEVSLGLQARLLRVLQERTIMRIGGDEVIDVDVRIISATNQNLADMVKSKEFRQDLYYRLNVLPLKIPSLRDRKDDMFLIIDEYKKRLHSEFVIDEEARREFYRHDWPGNIRELVNYVEYLSNIDENIVGLNHLPFVAEKKYSFETSGEYDGLYERFINENWNIDEIIFVLESLVKSYDRNERIGRRSISVMSKERGIYLSEQEVRSVLKKLQDYGLVVIKKGRGGTKVSDAGKTIFRMLKSKEKQNCCNRRM
ncbi:PAS domain S-box-containing protein [Dethiosulfatibacter aminovorans DSM 17477]|uniref:PAS domain S-box-containing protein n=1 Tax=Dethiosulfatibacter aminovorans DSM 17477 TaxID=1121476 RepID=A0A1M6APH8_9FIRM|nr:sigma 54-interacting transcriptional regulator [Dethiosulfatibacter aminovorans]SHI38386.1 PAS domain S-box-containing protein [Dethiosulfatibacter aminovorans DSM 17477]